MQDGFAFLTIRQHLNYKESVIQNGAYLVAMNGGRVFCTVSATGKFDMKPEAKRLQCSVCFRASGGRNGTVLENDEVPPEFPGVVLAIMDFTLRIHRGNASLFRKSCN